MANFEKLRSKKLFIFASPKESIIMKIKILVAILSVAISTSLSAQHLMVQGTSPKLHLVHTVAAKETWYGLGRLYNINPKELAAYNNLKMDAALSIGQSLKVPLQAANFSQNGAKAADEVLVPVYHTVQEKEWMFRISQNFNKVPVEKLEQWNNVSNNDLKPGMQIIVGHLKVKAGQSALASGAKNVQPTAQPPVAAANKPVNTPVKESQPEKKEVVDKAEPNKPAATESRPVSNRNIDYNGGYFRQQYGASGKAAAGTAGVFKSTSGWQDGKYYALMNNVPVGTIIKIDHPVTRKSVYAKVLGQLPEMKESTGLAIRLSDAAAAELGAGAFKFNVEVSY
jgi:LysM repeat protein